MDSYSLDEALHIPNILMVRGRCPQTFLFPGLSVYRSFTYLDDWSENPSSGNFLLHSDKDLVGIPSSAGSFDLASYPSRIWETLPTVYIGRSTFMVS